MGTAINARGFSAYDSTSFTGSSVLKLMAGASALPVARPRDTSRACLCRLSDLAAVTPLTPGTPVASDLTPSNETDLYRFSAAAGDSYYFARVSGSGGSGSDFWRLIDPYGNVLFGTSLGTDGGRLTLSATGSYTVLVEGSVA